MAASTNVSQLSTTFNKALAKTGVLVLHGYGIAVSVNSGHLVIEDGLGNDRRRFHFARVGHGLKRLIVIGSDGYISLSAVRWLTDQKTQFAFLDRDGSVLATSASQRASDSKLRRLQATALHSGAALRISRELIDRKLAGQEQVARVGFRNEVVAEIIKSLRAEIAESQSTDDLRSLEARAAKVYWSAWRDTQISFARQDILKVPDHWRSFGARISSITGSPRLAVNPANAMLNYLYALLEAETSIAAYAVGLDPAIGFFHADQDYRANLSCDLMEPVRPQVDAFILDWLSSEPLSRRWFFEQRDGNCRLMAEFTERLSETSINWARLVAPVVEWSVKMLSTDESWKQIRPTPLTQRHRSEGRGKSLETRVVFKPHKKICHLCGEGIGSGKYCSMCAPTALKENMRLAAFKRHSSNKNYKAGERTRALQSKHAVALTWFDPASLPSWFTENFYVENVQPKLTGLTTSRIMNELGVSRTYASEIRNGRTRPHPRHWVKLASLCGVTN